MARKKRIYTDTGKYHIILRGNNQQNLFYKDSDRDFFLNRLKKYSLELHIEIYAYCLMNNHIHILLGKANETLSLFVQKLANSYVYYFNQKYERSGHLFQGRFKSEPIEDEIYFKTVLRYILQNPEKAGISKTDRYKWGSYHQLFDEKSESWIEREEIISMFSGINQLHNFICEKNNDSGMEYENLILISDVKAIKMIKKLIGMHPSQFTKIHIDKAVSSFRILKEKGLSVSQISRLTGFSRKIIKAA